MNKESLRPFRPENVPAYLFVIGVWAGLSLLIALAAQAVLPEKPGFIGFLALALAAAAGGMAIMFVASAINLRRMRAGLERLAAGEEEPRIPPLWCPVLTCATQAVLSCAARLRKAGQAG